MNIINNSKISDEITKTFDNLTFNWPYFVLSVLTLTLVVLFVTFLVYKPLKKMLKARQEFIQNNINESIKAKEKALEAQESIDLKINDANIKVSNLILEAKSESEKIINDGMQKAQKQSELLLQQANILVEKKYKDFELEQKKIIIENAVELARKILKRELKDQDNKKLINELMEN